MKKKIIPLVASFFLLMGMGCFWYFSQEFSESTPKMTTALAIERITVQFPELSQDPWDSFLPYFVTTDVAEDGWDVAFVLEGSGVPIATARCFRVTNDGNITERQYVPSNIFSPGKFSAKECRVMRENLVGGDRDEHGCIGSAGYSWCERKEKCLRIWEESCEEDSEGVVCERENCHGLEIQCGANPPDFCTEMYGVGDRCLQYVECGIQDGKCQQIPNTKFTECKSCAQKCEELNRENPMEAFQCEATCL